MHDLIIAIKDYLDHNEHVKARTSKSLINFHETIVSEDAKLITSIEIKNSTNNSHKRKDATQDIINIKKGLIFYIGSWFINIQESVIDISDVAYCLGSFLHLEKKLLYKALKRYSSSPNYILYSDAKNCLDLFTICDKIKTGSGSNEDGKTN